MRQLPRSRWCSRFKRITVVLRRQRRCSLHENLSLLLLSFFLLCFLTAASLSIARTAAAATRAQLLCRAKPFLRTASTEPVSSFNRNHASRLGDAVVSAKIDNCSTAPGAAPIFQQASSASLSTPPPSRPSCHSPSPSMRRSGPRQVYGLRAANHHGTTFWGGKGTALQHSGHFTPTLGRSNRLEFRAFWHRHVSRKP